MSARNPNFDHYETDLIEELEDITRHRIITPDERANILARSMKLVEYFGSVSRHDVAPAPDAANTDLGITVFYGVVVVEG